MNVQTPVIPEREKGQQGGMQTDLLRTVPRGRCSSLKEEPRNSSRAGEGWSPRGGWSPGGPLEQAEGRPGESPPALAAAAWLERTRDHSD